MPKKSADVEKIQVTFNKAQLEMIDSLRGIFGSTRSEVVRSVVTNWLFEKKKEKGI